MPGQTNKRTPPWQSAARADGQAAPGYAGVDPLATFTHQPGSTRLPLYHLLSRLPGPRNFALRLFLYAVLCIQLPLCMLLLWLLTNAEPPLGALTILAVMLIAVLLGAASAALVLLAYNEPVRALSRAMQNHAAQEFEPELPERPADDIGQLLLDSQTALRKLQTLLHNAHELGIRDDLTGLYSRRFFSEQAAQFLHRAIRYDEPLTLIFVDLANFRLINAGFSSETSDAALRQIARLMSDTARDSDLSARIGAHEFVMMFPNTPIHNAVLLAERLRSNLQRHNWSVLLSGLVPTLGIGMAEAQVHDSVDKLIDRAAANLHSATSEGDSTIRH